MKSWVSKAINIINADYQRSADTHLIKLEQIAFRDIDIYLKDEDEPSLPLDSNSNEILSTKCNKGIEKIGKNTLVLSNHGNKFETSLLKI